MSKKIMTLSLSISVCFMALLLLDWSTKSVVLLAVAPMISGLNIGDLIWDRKNKIKGNERL